MKINISESWVIVYRTFPDEVSTVSISPLLATTEAARYPSFSSGIHSHFFASKVLVRSSKVALSVGRKYCSGSSPDIFKAKHYRNVQLNSNNRTFLPSSSSFAQAIFAVTSWAKLSAAKTTPQTWASRSYTVKAGRREPCDWFPWGLYCVVSQRSSSSYHHTKFGRT